ncbi:MAG: DUF4275 family protein [Bacillota bacterium]|nr:DUF4275 family protein [Bacillota bacterium]
MGLIQRQLQMADVIWNYKVGEVKREMDNNLKLKVLMLNSNEISGIKKTWENSFVPIETNKEKIHIDCMLWHIFSYNVRECEEGEDAINSFKAVLKDSVYIFYQRIDIGYKIDNSIRAFTFDDLSQFITDFETADIYITDKGFNWTFVKTHEDGLLGPYFCKR